MIILSIKIQTNLYKKGNYCIINIYFNIQILKCLSLLNKQDKYFTEIQISNYEMVKCNPFLKAVR